MDRVSELESHILSEGKATDLLWENVSKKPP
jgi:hypothetical protein